MMGLGSERKKVSAISKVIAVPGVALFNGLGLLGLCTDFQRDGKYGFWPPYRSLNSKVDVITFLML